MSGARSDGRRVRSAAAVNPVADGAHADGVPGSVRPDDDAVAHAKVLEGIFDRVLSDDPRGPRPRGVVSASWRRSLAAHVDPEHRTPPVVYDQAQLSAAREAHPLAEVLPLLRGTLASIADEAMHVMLVTDVAGNVLWRDGAAKLLATADGVGLRPGTNWSEQAIGTNAMGTALAVGRPVQIHSAEHLVRTYHSWTCVAAPVHDPDTGAMLGAVDVSGPLHTVHPALVQLVAAAAQLAEHHLRVRMAIADERLRMENMAYLTRLGPTESGALVTRTGRLLAGQPYGWWPDRVTLADGLHGGSAAGSDRMLLDNGAEVVLEELTEGWLLRSPTAPVRRAPAPSNAPALTLRFLGDGPPRATLDGRPLALTLRPAEVLTALVVHPDGLTGGQLAHLLYGDAGNQTTVRGEVHRLRGLVGADLLLTRPYRVSATVDSDVVTARQALTDGRIADALAASPGVLLPRSEAPLVRDLRDELAAGLRRAVLDTDDADLLHRLAVSPVGADDLTLHERLLELLASGDPRRPAITVRRDRLLQA